MKWLRRDCEACGGLGEIEVVTIEHFGRIKPGDNEMTRIECLDKSCVGGDTIRCSACGTDRCGSFSAYRCDGCNEENEVASEKTAAQVHALREMAQMLVLYQDRMAHLALNVGLKAPQVEVVVRGIPLEAMDALGIDARVQSYSGGQYASGHVVGSYIRTDACLRVESVSWKPEVDQRDWREASGLLAARAAEETQDAGRRDVEEAQE